MSERCLPSKDTSNNAASCSISVPGYLFPYPQSTKNNSQTERVSSSLFPQGHAVAKLLAFVHLCLFPPRPISFFHPLDRLIDLAIGVDHTMPSRRLTVPIPSPPSEYCAIPSRSALFPAGSQEATKLEAVLDHFSDEKLQILEKDKGTEKRGLDDVEKMFLVSLDRLLVSWQRN